jgi:hypothetical protein
MGIYRGPGGVGDATGDAASEAALAIAAAEEARVSANSAASSATSASNSATSSQGSADDANDSAIAAATSASSASVSATSASTSASNASTSATSAATSATNAATSESNTASLYDQFDDRYLGSKASDPTLDNDGNALLEGALYWNTGTKRLKIYNGTAWENTISTGSSGTVSSVDMTVPTGLQVTGNPVTTSGTLAVTYQSGYSIPTTTKQGQWDTAYSWGDHAIVGYLDTADIGTTVQAYDADLTTLGAGGSTARSFLGLAIGTDVQAYDVDTTKNDVANTFTANQIISVTDNSNAALRVTQLGTGNAILIEDAANPDSSPVVVDASGNVGIGVTTTSVPLMVRRDQATDTLVDLWNATNNSAASISTRYVTNNVAGSGTSTATITKAKTGAFSIKNNDASGFITLDTNAVERLRVEATGNVVFVNGIRENVFAVVDAAGVPLSPNNGTIQTWTLGASRTPTSGTWNAGESLTLMINDGTAFTITWTTIGVVWVGGVAPTLATTGFTVIELWKVGSTIYGALVGTVA